LLEAAAATIALPEANLPALPRQRETARPSAALVQLLKVLLTARCEENQVAPKLIASSDDIDRIAAEDDPDVRRCMAGGAWCSATTRSRCAKAGSLWRRGQADPAHPGWLGRYLASAAPPHPIENRHPLVPLLQAALSPERAGEADPGRP